MNQNLLETQYDVTEKSKLKRFYQNNKILIFSSIIFIIITLSSVTFYLNFKEKKIINLSNSYIDAKVYLENNEIDKATNILKEIIFSNNETYSTLAFFIILNENLIQDQKELLNIFDHILKENKFEKEIKDLLIFKKALFESDSIDEVKMLDSLNPLINKDSIWKPHALLLLGDYFSSKNEYLKAKDFYIQTLSLKNLQREFYEYARSRLTLILDE